MESATISLGCRCDAAWQIRRRFGTSRAFPFDWLVSPLPAITRLLRDGFDRITGNLEVINYHPNGWTVWNPDYRIFLHHEFARTPGGQIVPDWRDHVDEVAAKYRALGDRLFQTMKEAPAVTFIRRAGDFKMPGEQPLPTPPGQYLDLLDAIQDRMTARPRLILLNCTDTPDDPRIVADEVAQPSIEEMPDRSLIWRGSTIAYDAMFDRRFGASDGSLKAGQHLSA